MNKTVKHIIFAYLMLLGLVTKVGSELIYSFDDIELSDQIDVDKSEEGEEEKEELEEKLTVHLDVFHTLKDTQVILSNSFSQIGHYKLSKGYTLIFIPPPKQA